MVKTRNSNGLGACHASERLSSIEVVICVLETFHTGLFRQNWSDCPTSRRFLVHKCFIMIIKIQASVSSLETPVEAPKTN